MKSFELFTAFTFALLNPIKHFSLHAMLKFTPPQHQVKDFVDSVLWVFLGGKIKNEISTTVQS